MSESPGANKRKIREIGEFGLIKLISEIVDQPGDVVIVGIGDDAAAIEPPDGLALLTTDMLVEDVHFRLNWLKPRELGHKSLAVNISDIAAMAGVPRFAVVSLALDPNLPVSVVEEFYLGALEACEPHGIRIVGGDVSKGEKFAVNVALLGSVERELLRRRDEAKPGELLLVTGDLGASAAGLAILENPTLASATGNAERLIAAHKRPSPRVAEARAASRFGASAMEDISDGLASEIAHICEMSGVGAEVFADSIPIAPGLNEIAPILGKEPLDLALYGGEDYELVFTAPLEMAEAIREAIGQLGVTVSEVGRITEDQELILIKNGRESPLNGVGYAHF